MDTAYENVGAGGNTVLNGLARSVYLRKLVQPNVATLRKPISLLEVFRDWLMYMLLFSGLTALLDEALRFACWTIC